MHPESAQGRSLLFPLSVPSWLGRQMLEAREAPSGVDPTPPMTLTSKQMTNVGRDPSGGWDRAPVPNLSGTRTRFHGRQFSTNGWGWGAELRRGASDGSGCKCRGSFAPLPLTSCYAAHSSAPQRQLSTGVGVGWVQQAVTHGPVPNRPWTSTRAWTGSWGLQG